MEWILARGGGRDGLSVTTVLLHEGPIGRNLSFESCMMLGFSHPQRE